MPKKKSGIEVDSRRPLRAPDDHREESLTVLDGLLALYRDSGLGARRIVALRFPGEALTPHSRGPGFGVAALVRSRVVVELGAPPPQPRYERIAYEWIARLSMGAIERTAHLLCEVNLRGGYNGKLPRLLTQQQIGQATGQTSVNVNRTLQMLARERLIERTSKLETRIVDLEAFARFAGFKAEAFA